MGVQGRGGTVRHFDAEEQKQALRAERHRKADSRYRNRFAGAVSSLQVCVTRWRERPRGAGAMACIGYMWSLEEEVSLFKLGNPGHDFTACLPLVLAALAT
jgi:hypothetical protein